MSDGIRRGQRELLEQRIAQRLVDEGLLDAARLGEMAARCAPDALLSGLVNEGLVSAEIVATWESKVLTEDTDPSAPPDPLRTLAPGQTIGPVQLDRRIGGGAMGEVWAAHAPEQGTPLAIKFLRVDHEEALARFVREARIAMALEHPHIARVLEVGEHRGVAFLVQEFIAGGALAGERPSRPALAQILRDVADALAYAHAEGFIHRDLKPANLMRHETGRAVVIDFGLARAIEQATRLTNTGAVLGTPQYMAPEQAQGFAADPRSDLYGLGASMYALAAGRPPVTGNNLIEIVRRVATIDPDPLPEVDDLARIVNRLMQRERDARYPDAATLLQDAEACLAGDPLPSTKKRGFFGRLFGDGASGATS